jgi:hypothetical protein
MTDKKLPKSIRTKALRAIAAIHAWNAAVHQARQQEALDGCPGRYEYDLMTDLEHMEMRLAMSNGLWALDQMEQAARAQGLSPQEFYAQVGTERPAVIAEGAKVVTWRKGDR